jgi:hypothetical protein
LITVILSVNISNIILIFPRLASGTKQWGDGQGGEAQLFPP